MKDSILMLLLLQLILIFLNAVFASAEIAVLQVNEAKLQKLASQGNKKAGRLLKLTAEPARFLSTIQVAITLSGFLGSAFAAENFSDPLVDWVVSMGAGLPREALDTLAVILITLILSYVTLIFGELVPKRIAMKRAESLSMGISGLIFACSKLFAPIVWLLTVSTNGVLRLMGIDPREEEQSVGEEEIRLMAASGSESGGIDHEENLFIQNVFEFDDIEAGDIATHRRELDVLWMEDPMEDWERLIHSSRHSYYPVCDDTSDNVVGILNAKDYFRLENKDRDTVMAMAVKEPYFVPETIKADMLFKEMRKTRNSFAVVIDEHAGVVGVVTLNDLVEQLVGDLGDDEPEELTKEPKILPRGQGLWEIVGNPELQRIEEVTGIGFDTSCCETLTGLIFDVLDKVLPEGEQDMKILCPGAEIRVKEVKEHMIERAYLRALPEEESPGQGSASP